MPRESFLGPIFRRAACILLLLAFVIRLLWLGFLRKDRHDRRRFVVARGLSAGAVLLVINYTDIDKELYTDPTVVEPGEHVRRDNTRMGLWSWRIER